MVSITFFKELPENLFHYAIVVAVHQNRFVFVKHKERDTWELPAGHIESGETPLQAAKRELWEETGAARYQIQQIGAVTVDHSDLCSVLFFAEIDTFDPLPNFEIEQVAFFDDIPESLTYPQLQPEFIRLVLEEIER